MHPAFNNPKTILTVTRSKYANIKMQSSRYIALGLVLLLHLHVAAYKRKGNYVEGMSQFVDLDHDKTIVVRQKLVVL